MTLSVGPTSTTMPLLPEGQHAARRRRAAMVMRLGDGHRTEIATIEAADGPARRGFAERARKADAGCGRGGAVRSVVATAGDIGHCAERGRPTS